MDFSTSAFWFSLIPALLILIVGDALLRRHPVAKQRFHKWLMMATSLVLLGIASHLTLGIFLLVTLVAYAVCCWVQHMERGRKLMLALLIILLLLPLLYYKYGYFICSNLSPSREWDALKDLIIPIGISFYTFQVIGFCIDTLIHRLPIPRLTDYMNFCCYFPQIVAGPIERRADLLPQVQSMELPLHQENLYLGLRYIILGLFFKSCVADNLAAGHLGMISVHAQSALLLWCTNLCFTFRIYFDFAGYGLTAYGLARCMGITLRMNFLSPYTATNVTDFWRRWHTSLTLWFRDYIYFPMGGSRTRRWALNIFIVFLISGLWHGANWNFLIWGALIALTMVVYRLYRSIGRKLPVFVGWLLTFGSMVFIWMFFYIQDMGHLAKSLCLLVTPDAYDAARAWAVLQHGWIVEILVMVLPSLLLSMFVIAAEAFSLRVRQDPYELLIHPYTCGVMVFLLVTYTPGISNPFIYFAF